MTMTRNEFQAVYDSGPEATFALVQELQARVAQLSSRLSKNSHNSSKPPSSDGLAKKPPKTKSLRHKTGNKPGAQPGHPGTTLCLSQKPDKIILHSPRACSSCGLCLEPVAATGYERRQVLDLPPLCLQVVEHRALCKRCPACQSTNQAAFAGTVSQAVQYGERIKALCVYLLHYQLLPFERTRALLGDLFGCSLSAGTLASTLGTCYQGLEGVESAIKETITTAPVAHFDETGLRRAGKTCWLHSASTEQLTFYAHHDKRGKTAIDAIGVLPLFNGTSVHDAWPSYLGYCACSHGLCNAHLLRELTFVKEQMKQPWAGQMVELLLELKQAVQDSRAAGGKQLCQLPDLEARYQAIVAAGLAAQGAQGAPAPPRKRGCPKQSVAKNLLDRLLRYRSYVLAFAHDFAVPFDNNLAERDLRMAKVRQKVSGCFRSAEGASWFCRIRGYISTLRKQGCPVLSALQSVFAGNPYMPALQA